MFMIYAPHFVTKRGGIVAIILSTAATIVWFVMGNPFGIDNIYVALCTAALVLLVDSAINRIGGTSVEVAKA